MLVWRWKQSELELTRIHVDTFHFLDSHIAF